MIDTASAPGSWAAILPHCQNIRIIEHRASVHLVAARETCEAAAPAVTSPFQTPDPLLSIADHPGGNEAHPASSVAAARGNPVSEYCAVKDGNGAFHGERNA